MEQARGLLRVAKEFDPEMLPVLAIGLFAGLVGNNAIRPENAPILSVETEISIAWLFGRL